MIPLEHKSSRAMFDNSPNPSPMLNQPSPCARASPSSFMMLILALNLKRQKASSLNSNRFTNLIDGCDFTPADLLAAEAEESALFSSERDFFGHN